MATEPELLETQKLGEKVAYQYLSDMSYAGTYVTKYVGEPHCPPNMTFVPPPTGIPEGQEAAFDPVKQEWFIRAEDLSWMDPDSLTRMLAHRALLGAVQNGS